ncbi:hypothetical protein CCP4SC76_7770003 [Gammaproteobacteria bacterium]
MKTQPIVYHLPKDALDSFRNLAKDVEKMSGALLKTINALEVSLSPQVTNTPEDRVGDLLKRFDDVALSLNQLVTRVVTLETRGATTMNSEPPSTSHKGMAVDESGDAEENTPQASDASASQGKKPNRGYPEDVRRMAVDMRKQGRKSVDIIRAIHEQCGHAPDKSNLSKVISRWEKESDVSSEPADQQIVLPVSTKVESKSISALVPSERSDSDEIAGEEVPQVSGSTIVLDKRVQRSYPPNIRKMAVDMRRKGKSNDAIISAIQKKCGYAPDKGNLSTYLNRWESSTG